MEEEHPMRRVAFAQHVQSFVDNPDFLWKDGCTLDEVYNLQKYLTEKGIAVPKIPSGQRGEDVKKVMYRIWAGMECLDLMRELLGVDNTNPVFDRHTQCEEWRGT
jgi:hypothetical protein